MTTPIAEVAFLDVGQGHATVVTTDSHSLLVDCPPNGASVVNAFLADAGSDRLDGCFVTHRDLDHCGGVRGVIESYPARRIYFNPSHSVPAEGEGLPLVRSVLKSILSTADLTGSEWQIVSQGESGTLGPIRWRVMMPTDQMMFQASLDNIINRASIVLMVEIESIRFLITGDIDGPAISELLGSGQDVAADVLLAPHHGARLRNFASLVDAVSPSYGVVSVGRSAAHHPARETLEELSRKRGCRVICTQVNHMCHEGKLDESFCAGSIRFLVGTGGVEVAPSVAFHGSRIDEFDTPICRLAAPTPVASPAPS